VLAVQPIDVVPAFVRVKFWFGGVKGPPSVPEKYKSETGLTVKPPMLRLTLRDVLPLPFVVLVKMAAAVYAPAANALAEGSIETVTVVVAPGAKVLLPGETSTHAPVVAAVQDMLRLPEFPITYEVAEGTKGPPTGPDEENAVAGVTVMGPAAPGALIVTPIDEDVTEPIPAEH